MSKHQELPATLRAVERLIGRSALDESLSKKVLKRLRKRKKAHEEPEPTGSSDQVPVPQIGATLPGPGAFGPVSIGGIMRHS